MFGLPSTKNANTTNLHVHSWFVKSRPQSSDKRVPHVPEQVHGAAILVYGYGCDDASSFPLADRFAANGHAAGFEEPAQFGCGALCAA